MLYLRVICLLAHHGQASEVQAWFDDGRQLLMDHVRHTKILSESAIQEANRRIRDLALTSNQQGVSFGDQQGVSFGDDEMHFVYFDTKFERRGTLLYMVFERIMSGSSSEAGWKYSRAPVVEHSAAMGNAIETRQVPNFEPCTTFQGPRGGMCFKTGDKGLGYYADAGDTGIAGEAEVVLNRAKGAAASLSLLQRRLLYPIESVQCGKQKCPRRSSILKVASIGGGPGTDASGLVWANKHFMRFQGTGGVQCRLFDKEASWGQYLPTLQQLMHPTVQLSFDTCDITVAIEDGCNTQLAKAVADTQLWIFSYVCHETSPVCAAGVWAFYRSLAQKAQPGSVFLFMDVIKHSAQCFDDIHGAMNEALAARAQQEAAATGIGPDTASFTRLELPSDRHIKATVMVLFRTDQTALEAVAAAERAQYQALATSQQPKGQRDGATSSAEWSHTWDANQTKLGMKLKKRGETVQATEGVVLTDVTNLMLADVFKQSGIKLGMQLKEVAGENVEAMSYEAVLEKVKAAGRPLTITFCAGGESAPAAEKEAAATAVAEQVEG